MLPALLAILASGILSEIVVLLAILLVVFIIFKLGKVILKFIFGILANSIMGFVTIFIANYFFALGIPYTWRCSSLPQSSACLRWAR